MSNRFCTIATFLALLLSLGTAVRWLSTQPSSNPLRPFLASETMTQWRRSTTTRMEEIMDDETATLLYLSYIFGGTFVGSVVMVAIGNFYVIWRARNNPIIPGQTSLTRSTGSPTETTSLLSGSDGSSYSAGSEPGVDPFAGVNPYNIANRPELERGRTMAVRLRMHTDGMTWAEAMAYDISEREAAELPVTVLPLQPEPQTLEATVTEIEPLKKDDDETLLPSGSLSPITEETPLLASPAVFVLTHITYDRSRRATQQEESPGPDEPATDVTLDTPDGSPDIATPSIDDHTVLSVTPVPEWRRSWETSEWTGTEVDDSTRGVAVNASDQDNDDSRALLVVSPPPGSPLPSYNPDASRPPSYVYEFAPLHPDAEQRPRRIVVSQGTIDQDGMVTGLRPRISCGDIINMETFSQLVSDGVSPDDAMVAALIRRNGEPPAGPLGLALIPAAVSTYTRPPDTVPFPVAPGSRSATDTNSDRNSLFLSSEEGSDPGSNRLSQSLDERRNIPHEPRQRRLAMSLRDQQVPHIGPRPSRPPIIVRSARTRHTLDSEHTGHGPAEVGTPGVAATGETLHPAQGSSETPAMEDPADNRAHSDAETIYANGNSNYSSTPSVEMDSQIAEDQGEAITISEVEAAQNPGDGAPSLSPNVASQSRVDPSALVERINIGTSHVNGNSNHSHSSSVASNAHEEAAEVSDQDVTPMAAPVALPSLPMANGDHPTVAPAPQVPYHHPPWLHPDNTTSWSDSSDEHPAAASSDESSHNGSAADLQEHGVNGNGYQADWSHSSGESGGDQSSLDEHDPRRDSGIA